MSFGQVRHHVRLWHDHVVVIAINEKRLSLLLEVVHVGHGRQSGDRGRRVIVIVRVRWCDFTTLGLLAAFLGLLPLRTETVIGV